MSVDVITETVIERPASVVAAYAGDPANAPTWYVNIKSAVWKTTPPIAVGSRIAFVASFLGRKLEYTYEVTELVPERKLVMRTAQGPFPMETVYTWEPLTEATSKMTLRNQGAPSGFSKIFAPLMASAMKKAMTKDLARLKELLEKRPA